jgi:hypothetical protein
MASNNGAIIGFHNKSKPLSPMTVSIHPNTMPSVVHFSSTSFYKSPVNFDSKTGGS